MEQHTNSSASSLSTVPSTAATLPTVLERTTDRLLDLVSQGYPISKAAAATGMARSTVYHRLSTDPVLANRMDVARQQARDNLREDVLQKASILSGEIIEEVVLDENGEPLLDSDFEFVTRRRLINYEPTVINKLLGTLVHTEDGPSRIEVRTTVTTPEPPRRIVKGEDACLDLSLPDVIDTEFVEVDNAGAG